jgi:hypothetical protein
MCPDRTIKQAFDDTGSPRRQDFSRRQPAEAAVGRQPLDLRSRNGSGDAVGRKSFDKAVGSRVRFSNHAAGAVSSGFGSG